MSAFQWKVGLIMVEKVGSPTFETMTSPAIRDSVFVKLWSMHIVMAGHTRSIQTYKLPIRKSSLRDVTCPTILLKMHSEQLKRCLVMVESAVLPTRGQMALITPIFRIIFRGDMAIVNVIMTVHTLAPQVAEDPFFLFEMTGKTRGSQMRSVQWESRFGVVFKRIETAFKSLNSMAICTIPDSPFPGKLTFMIIRVTGCAGVVGKGIQQTLGMAVPAVDLLVFPDKGKFGQAVIELVQILD